MTPQEEVELLRKIEAAKNPQEEVELLREYERLQSQGASPVKVEEKQPTGSMSEMINAYVDKNNIKQQPLTTEGALDVGSAVLGAVAEGTQSIPVLGDAVKAASGAIGGLYGDTAEVQEKAKQQAMATKPEISGPLSTAIGMAGSGGLYGKLGGAGLSNMLRGLGLSAADEGISQVQGEKPLSESATNLGLETALSLPGYLLGKFGRSIPKNNELAASLEKQAQQAAVRQFEVPTAQLGKVMANENLPVTEIGQELLDNVLTPGMTRQEALPAFQAAKKQAWSNLDQAEKGIDSFLGKETGQTRTGVIEQLQDMSQKQFGQSIKSPTDERLRKIAERIMPPDMKKQVDFQKRMDMEVDKLMPEQDMYGNLTFPDEAQVEKVFKNVENLRSDELAALERNKLSLSELADIRRSIESQFPDDQAVRALATELRKIEDSIANSEVLKDAGIEHKLLKRAYSKYAALGEAPERAAAKEFKGGKELSGGLPIEKRNMIDRVGGALAKLALGWQAGTIIGAPVVKAGIALAEKYKPQLDAAGLYQKAKKLKSPEHIRAITAAAQEGPAALSAAHYLLMQKDEQYRKQMTEKEE